MPVRKPDRHNPVANIAKTVKPGLLFRAVVQVSGDNPARVRECVLRGRERNAMLSLIETVLFRIPFKTRFGHP
ncbi:MAG: hypothetical protein WD078_10205 [Woeseia sp.]